ncbi:predicted protein [Nematostella vectensis]|uniref:Uncharacterized protein n=1 Tax=Nematostella vectensis TaxID=45351 RepID=A7S894_NEMVE|nr:predicted protein [Nematostella vectensis]|eukprot:XP_001632086.1 predicted protein [Nematostella vectensis]
MAGPGPGPAPSNPAPIADQKNEKEKELIKLQEAHESQQILLQKLQTCAKLDILVVIALFAVEKCVPNSSGHLSQTLIDENTRLREELVRHKSKVQKYKTLQETCKKQEKTCAKLDILVVIALFAVEKCVPNSSGHLSQTLIDENTRLREELVRHKGLLKEAESMQASTRESTLLLSGAGMGDEERLGLLHKLEKAEGRILGLEKQMTESARKWAKEKADLQMRLNELTLSQQTGYKNSFSAFDVRQIQTGYTNSFSAFNGKL